MTSFEIVLSLDGTTVSRPTGDDVFQPDSRTLSRGSILQVDLTQMLNALDGCVRLSEATSVAVLVDRFLYNAVRDKASFIEEWMPYRGVTRQLWRCLDDPDQVRLDSRVCRYPEIPAPLKDAAAPELGRSRGYWIIESESNTPLTMMKCFG
ncbi:hypothetical protein K4F52_003276 [Lecanicillium sp. MT-2017a]|nr:hypothetical protein K4F52_003276 [Lecanicillium sp. MT-2017a]